MKSKILSMFGKNSMPQVHFFANKLINRDPMSDQEIVICFMLVALNSFLCPNSSLTPSSSYLGAFDDIEKVKDFDWSKLVLDWLLEKVKDFTRSSKVQKTLGGCLYYLAVSFVFYQISVFFLHSMICCTENLVFLWALLFAVHMCVYFFVRCSNPICYVFYR